MVRSLLFSTAAVDALGLGCGQAAATEGSGRRPNIVFFLADDHTTQAISCYGSKLTTTPHIDRIAAGIGDGPQD